MVGRTLIGFREAQKGNPSCLLCSSPLCFALVRAQAGCKQLTRGQRSLNWTTRRQWRRARHTVGQMVAQRLPECLPGLKRQWWVCGRQVGAGLEILLDLLWPHCPVPRFPPVEKEDDPTLSAMAPNVTVEGTTPGPVAGEREKQAGASPPRPAPRAPRATSRRRGFSFFFPLPGCVLASNLAAQVWLLVCCSPSLRFQVG